VILFSAIRAKSSSQKEGKEEGEGRPHRGTQVLRGHKKNSHSLGSAPRGEKESKGGETFLLGEGGGKTLEGKTDLALYLLRRGGGVYSHWYGGSCCLKAG